MEKQLMVIIGKTWQDSDGNTYHTSEVISKDINFKTKRTYGYGNQFIITVKEELLKTYNIDINDYMVIDRAMQVGRKKDL